jgi:hypothetical protein
MPAYNATPPRTVGRYNTTTLLNEAGVSLALPYKSQQVALTPNAAKLGRYVDLAVQFGAAPGAFSLVLETAAIDADTNYITQGAAITAADSGFAVNQKIDIPEQHNFARVRFTALTNNVNVLATITPC